MLTGKRVGTYIILEKVSKRGAHESRYKCSCTICGRTKERDGSSLIRNGKIAAKGCRYCSRVKGEFNGWEKERAIWKDMIDRCHKKKDRLYKYYGARGIAVCKRWKNSFWAFTKDIGKIKEGLSIERINNEKGYSLKNCKLIPRREQALNRRSTRWITIKGKTKCLMDWMKIYRVSGPLFYARKRRGMSDQEALISPKKYIGMWLHLAER